MCYSICLAVVASSSTTRLVITPIIVAVYVCVCISMCISLQYSFKTRKFVCCHVVTAAIVYVVRSLSYR